MLITFATQLTVLRIFLIPVFVLFAMYYGESVAVGSPKEWLRGCAIGVFVIASITDAFDGYIARRFRQVSKVGAILDPIADKGLLIAAIITLSVSDWHYALPLWFPVLVIARDALILLGCVVMRLMYDHLDIKPSWTGKTATALLMIALAWAMFQIPHLEFVVWPAGLFTLISGLEYVWRGIAQLHHHESNGISQ